MREQTLQHLIPIAGAGYAILPEVALLEQNTFETSRHAQQYGLEVLPLKAVFRTARAVKPEEPTKEFRKYAGKVDEGLRPDEIDEAYRRLHEQIWEQYSIRAKEVLILPRPTVHPRVVGSKETTQLKSTLLRDYRVPENDEDVFDISGIETTTIDVQWPTKKGKIPEALVELFDADPATFVYTNPDINFAEGIRSLDASFWGREGPDLYSYEDSWVGYSVRGSLLGRKISSTTR